MTIEQLVLRERRWLRIAVVLCGVALALAVAAVIVAVSAVALGHSRWITHPSAPLLAWVVAVVLVVAVLWWTSRLMRRAASRPALAVEIERERALRAGALRGALEVAHTGALGRRGAEEVSRRLTSVQGMLAPALQRRAWRRGLLAALGAGAAVVLLAAARRIAPDGWRAMRHPVGVLTGSALPPLTIVDVPRFVLRGEQLRIQVRAPERREVTLHVRTTGAPWSARALAVRAGTATTVLGPVDADVILVAADGRTTSDTAVVRVTDRPFVGDVSIQATYPAYLHRASETISAGQPVRVPRGTALGITGRASVALTRIALLRGEDTLDLSPSGNAFAGRLDASTSGRWRWAATGSRGPIPDVPAPLELDVVPDSAPTVDILAPEGDTTTLTAEQLTLRMAASDDHGLRTVLLRSWRTLADGRTMPAMVQRLASPKSPQWSGETELDVGARSLQPGDVLHLAVIATDNSPWRQSASSREIVVRLPSLAEQREMARSMADSTVAHAAAAAAAEHDLEERTEAAARSRSDRRVSGGADSRNDGGRNTQQHSMSYQSAEQARALAKQQQALQQQVHSLQQDAQRLQRQLQAAGAMDSTLRQQLQQAQSLLQKALTPELQQQLEALRKASQQLSGEDARAALQRLTQSQQQLREALERSAQMLKRAAMEGTMQTLRDDAREIASQEHRMSDSLSRGRGDSSAARKASDLSDRSRTLAQRIQQTAKELQQQHAQAGPKQLQSAAQQAEKSANTMQQATQGSDSAGQSSAQGNKGSDSAKQSGTQGSMRNQSAAARDAAQQSQSAAARNGAQQSQSTAARNAAQQMDQAAQQLSNARQSQIQEWKNQLTGNLDRSIQETLQLARQQRQLAQRARSGKQDPALRGDQSAVQQGINKVGERLEQASRQSANVSSQSRTAVGQARQRVQDATQQVADSKGRGSPQTAQAMDDAAQALTKAAAELVKDRTRVGQGQSASGLSDLLKRMQAAAQKQGSLNSQSASLLPIPGGQPSPQMIARARALAERQRALAKQLDNTQAGGAAARANELAKEMRQIASKLESGHVDQTLLDRQQRLFHRLLDSGLSLEKNEREDTGQREGETATGREGVITPGSTVTSRKTMRFQPPDWKDLRGLSADERRAVMEYFKRINAERP